MFFDKEFSIWQNIVINFKLKKALKEVEEGKTKEWKQVYKKLKERK